MLFGGGGARGGGGNTIIGGLDLSTTDATFEGVRERATTSSMIAAADNVDSMDFRRSECEVRGRGINELEDSLRPTDGEGAETGGKEMVVGPAEGGGEMNWNC